MKLQLMQPQEIEVFYILPAIRSGMASALKKQGVRQKEIAGLLCVQESTISQYLSCKRATEVKLPEKVKSEISDSVKKIRTKEDLVRETQHILSSVREEKDVLCGLHRSIADIPKGCNICYKRKHE